MLIIVSESSGMVRDIHNGSPTVQVEDCSPTTNQILFLAVALFNFESVGHRIS